MRLRSTKWDGLTEKERKRLHDTRAYLQELSSIECKPIVSSPERVEPAVGESEERPMGPPKSITSRSQSGLRVITSATPELKSGSGDSDLTVKPSNPIMTGIFPPLGEKVNREVSEVLDKPLLLM